jgi:predicted 2-oxoglutarate/Fe(II)-dependent dioxygenase YbiX
MSLYINGFFPGELTADATVGGCIDIYENAWPNPQRTIKMIEDECSNTESDVYWQKAETIGQGAFQNARSNKMLGITYFANLHNNPVMQNIHNQFNMLLLATTNVYARKYNIQETFYHESYSLLKYSAGQEYKEHYDGATSMGRCISCLVYLNNDYGGGEIEFPNFGVKIKPEPGMLVIFPSNFAYRHIAHPVTEGNKYSLVTWIKDRYVE